MNKCNRYLIVANRDVPIGSNRRSELYGHTNHSEKLYFKNSKSGLHKEEIIQFGNISNTFPVGAQRLSQQDDFRGPQAADSAALNSPSLERESKQARDQGTRSFCMRLMCFRMLTSSLLKTAIVLQVFASVMSFTFHCTFRHDGGIRSQAAAALHAQHGAAFDFKVSRSDFLLASSGALGASMAALLSPMAAAAKDIDPSLKGTKKDPEFEACLSKCMYLCTKPKGEEQKSRSECLPECKGSCATTKQQLMTGTPLSR